MEIIAAFIAGAAIFMALAYVVRARALQPAEARLKYLSPRTQVVAKEESDGKVLLRRDASSIPAISGLLSRRGYAAKWAEDLERAGVTLRPGEYFLMRVMAGIIASAIVMLIFRSAFGFVIAIAIGMVAYMIPAFWLNFKVKSRINKINGQLVETITLIAGAQRAGFAFAQGVDVAAKRVGPPMSVELNRMLLDINLGASTEDSLRAMNDRIGSDDVDMVVTAILIQRQTGGNLSEVLDNVTETMRDRERIKGEIKTLTSAQRFTGYVLSAWPMLLGLAFFAINPSMMSLLWTTGPGIALLILWGFLNLMGFFTIRRILAIDI
jgi:tight adherence protein B